MEQVTKFFPLISKFRQVLINLITDSDGNLGNEIWVLEGKSDRNFRENERTKERKKEESSRCTLTPTNQHTPHNQQLLFSKIHIYLQ